MKSRTVSNGFKNGVVPGVQNVAAIGLMRFSGSFKAIEDIATITAEGPIGPEFEEVRSDDRGPEVDPSLT